MELDSLASLLQTEGRRYLAALASRAQIRGSAQFTVAELVSISDSLDLNVPDIYAILDELNEAGVLRACLLLQVLASRV